MNTYEIQIAQGTKYEIRLYAVRCGQDLTVTMTGGTAAHVGAVTVASGRLPDGSLPKYSATASTIVLPDHKDDAVSKQTAVRLADAIHATVSVSAGIHIDNATQEELKLLQQNCNDACEQLISKLCATKC